VFIFGKLTLAGRLGENKPTVLADAALLSQSEIGALQNGDTILFLVEQLRNE